MWKNKPVLITLFFGLLALITLILYWSIISKPEARKSTNISVIVYGNNPERWTALKKGIEQAASDMDVNVNFLIMSKENDPAEQRATIERAIEDNAKGLLIAATDSSEMADYIKRISEEIPVVMVETTALGVAKYNYISVDNYVMGRKLGAAITKDNSKDTTICIYAPNRQRQSVEERLTGLSDKLEEDGFNLVRWEMGKSDMNEDLFIEAKLKQSYLKGSEKKIAIAALDNNSLELIVGKVENILSTNEFLETVTANPKIYGIGNTDKIVHYLDKGYIEQIVFQNEFNMGYLGMETLLNKMHKTVRRPNVDISFSIVNKETMYLPENERLLFPIVR